MFHDDLISLLAVGAPSLSRSLPRHTHQRVTIPDNVARDSSREKKLTQVREGVRVRRCGERRRVRVRRPAAAPASKPFGAQARQAAGQGRHRGRP